MSYIAAKKGGRVWNGAQRDSGIIFHAISKGNWYDPALCGAKTGIRSYGWVEEESETVSCPKCVKKIQELSNPSV
jgi:hypothetical protein